MPDTKDAAAQSQQRSDTDGVQTSSLAGTTSPPGASTGRTTTRRRTRRPPPPSGRQHEAGAGARHDGGGSDTPWATIGIALAAALLGATGGAAVASRTRRSGAAA